MEIKGSHAFVVDGSALYCVLRMQKFRPYQDLTSSSKPPRAEAKLSRTETTRCVDAQRGNLLIFLHWQGCFYLTDKGASSSDRNSNYLHCLAVDQKQQKRVPNYLVH